MAGHQASHGELSLGTGAVSPPRRRHWHLTTLLEASTQPHTALTVGELLIQFGWPGVSKTCTALLQEMAAFLRGVTFLHAFCPKSSFNICHQLSGQTADPKENVFPLALHRPAAPVCSV